MNGEAFSRGLPFVQDDMDMARSLSNHCGSAQGPRLEPFHRRPLIHRDLFYIETIDVNILLLRRIRYG